MSKTLGRPSKGMMLAVNAFMDRDEEELNRLMEEHGLDKEELELRLESRDSKRYSVGRKAGGSEEGQTVCYLCKVRDPNVTHYDGEAHHICLICGVKLWEVAQAGIEFDCRGQTVILDFKEKRHN